MKKLLVITSSLPCTVDALTGYFVFDLAQSLLQKGLAITILTPHIVNAAFFQKVQKIRIIRFPYFYPLSLQKIADRKGIGYNIDTSVFAKIQIPIFVCSELLFSVLCLIKGRYDSVHTHWIVPQGFIGSILSYFFKTTHICSVHAADVFLLKRFFFHKQILRFIIHHTTHFFIVSSHVHKTLLELISEEDMNIFLNKSTILPMGISHAEFCQEMDICSILQRYNIDKKTLILYLGRLSDKKGVEYLIEAMSKIIHTNTCIKLIICGDGPKKSELLDLVERHTLEGYVDFLGFITQEQKRELLCIADIMVIPSIILPDGETEGMPVVLLEGMAAGKAIIATKVSGISDIISHGKNGLLVDQRSASDIADSVLKLINNSDLRTEIGDNAKVSSYQYDWKNISQKYFEILSR